MSAEVQAALFCSWCSRVDLANLAGVTAACSAASPATTVHLSVDGTSAGKGAADGNEAAAHSIKIGAPWQKQLQSN